MKPPKCRLCGHEHWLSEPHIFASNTESASNGASNKASGVTRKKVVAVPVSAGDASTVKRPASGVAVRAAQSSADARPSKQRWNREAYNAYQREYMRKRRAGAV